MQTLYDLSGDDIIDTRELAERRDYLEAEKEALLDAMNEARDAFEEADEEFRETHVRLDGEDPCYPPHITELIQAVEEAERALAEWDGEEELEQLRDIFREGTSEFEYGETLIRTEYFTQYAKELASDCDEIPDTWPHRHIDWDAAAEDLQQDYASLDIGYDTYWFRNC